MLIDTPRAAQRAGAGPRAGTADARAGTRKVTAPAKRPKRIVQPFDMLQAPARLSEARGCFIAEVQPLRSKVRSFPVPARRRRRATWGNSGQMVPRRLPMSVATPQGRRPIVSCATPGGW